MIPKETRDYTKLVKGKKKKGGIKVKKGSELFRIIMTSKEEFIIRSLISGHIIGMYIFYEHIIKTMLNPFLFFDRILK